MNLKSNAIALGTGIFTAGLAIISGCSSFGICDRYMDTCLISPEKEKNLLNPSNSSNQSQLYKSNFYIYKMKIDTSKYKAKNIQKAMRKSIAYTQTANYIMTEDCKLFSKNKVSSLNKEGIGTVLLDILKVGKKIYCN